MKFNLGKKFKKKLLGAAHKETHNNCVHVFDHTYVQPASASLPCWNNVHGYKGGNNEWYAAVDMRVAGIRVQNIIVQCQYEETMNKWINYMKYSSTVIDKARNSGNHYRGSTLDTCYTFNCTDGSSKDYNITDTSDFYVWDLD